MSSLENREVSLLNNEALLASMFLEARYAPLLSEENCTEAKNLLKKVYNTLNGQENDSLNTSRHLTLSDDSHVYLLFNE